ncbi:hypothetical protein PCA01_23360 [Pseudoalteromonas carrageenovora]|uniref:Uncharacterized protein n=1 Tax=Pseudoalteromonas carrageenovora IAM 12662 TaxID=1314868 RepID=A0A2K4XFX7_PSEVC|nr:hypothetical protein PCA01_23360 [Pseudoalteromonas carrageenovora]SOU43211.1 Putative protein of unknown function [Pseudoalteromonas carrageenovora IAM 12662]
MIINPDRFSSMFEAHIEVVVGHDGYYFTSLSFLILFLKELQINIPLSLRTDCERGEAKQVNSERSV